MTSIRQRVAAARHRLQDAGIPRDEAELDARLLAEHVLGWTTERFFSDATTPSSPAFERAYEALIVRREAREPFAYIVGSQEFWGLDFVVTPAVLIPRPETELIVESALKRLAAASRAIVADIGTGSGCIAIALARERPAIRVVATDSSDAALAIARANAGRHGVAARIDFRRSDLFEGIPETFDAIVSNPPYVRDADRDGLQPEVRYEPALALFAGGDGLDAIRRLVAEAPDRLKPNGTLIFEFGFGQADAIDQLISRTPGLTMIDLRHDLQDIPRTAIVRRT